MACWDEFQRGIRRSRVNVEAPARLQPAWRLTACATTRRRVNKLARNVVIAAVSDTTAWIASRTSSPSPPPQNVIISPARWLLCRRDPMLWNRAPSRPTWPADS